jgi:hypothetical protein
MRRLLFLFILLHSAIIAFTQSSTAAHKVGCSACVYNKNYDGGRGIFVSSETCGCVPCSEKRKKEKVAIAAEKKSRQDALNAKIKAEREAKDKAFAAEQKRKQEEAKKPQSGEVLINAQPVKGNVTKAPVPIKAKITDKVIFASGGGNYSYSYKPEIPFKNEKGEIIIENPEWSATFTPKDVSFTADAPDNFGVVRIGDKNFYRKDHSFNLVNAKGEYLLNDGQIYSMLHIRHGWFLIASKMNKYYLMNMQTKKKITLPHYGPGDEVTVDQVYVPVFSNQATMKSSPIDGSVSIGSIFPSKVKSEMVKYFPNKVDEKVLSRYSFVLFHTDYGSSNVTLSDYHHFVYYNKTNEVGRIEMYGIKENGEMETIRIK